MSRFDPRPSFEAAIARLHFIQVITTLGQQASGTYIVIVPQETEAEKWVRPALAYLREIRHVTDVSDIEQVVDHDDSPLVYDAALLTADGIYSGHSGPRCMLFLTEAGHEDLRHPSVQLADGIIGVEFDAELVVHAAAEMGRGISAADAKLLITMPLRHRRLALLSPRPISESHKLHLIALEAEEAAKVAENVKVEKRAPLTKRNVPSGTRLEDLYGYGEAKNWGLEVIRDVKDYLAETIGWEDLDGGILLSGPPGCGKTTFARALAVSAGCHFVTGSYSQWQSAGHQGDMLKAMRAAFDEAKRFAPSVLIIDEIDGFVDRDRANDNSDYMRGVVNGILELIDGSFDRTGVIIVGSTNYPDIVDPAIRRAGRLDRHIAIGLPNNEDRLVILAQHLGVDKNPGFGLKAFSRHTDGMSGADLERLARDARRLARRDGTALKHVHVCRAFPKRVKRTADEIRNIVVHEIGHAVVAAVLGAAVHEVAVYKDRDPDAKDAIAGYAAVEARPGLRDHDWYADRVAHALGGMAAERMFFGSHGDGVLADLKEATNIATFALVSLGMGDTLVSDGHGDPAALAADRQFDPLLRRRVDEMLQEQASRARGILERNRGAVEELIEILVLRGRIEGETVNDAIRANAPVQLLLEV
jgi:cell division protease FtsH